MKGFLVLLALVAHALPTHGAAAFKIDVVRLGPRVAVFHGGPWDNGIVALATPKGLVVVDAPFSRTMGRGFREAIAAEFKRDDFACLINTHEHECHVGGNEAFADLPIVGHDSVRREMLASMKDPDRVRKTREIGERELAQVRGQLQASDPGKLDAPGFKSYEQSWQVILADLKGNPAPVPPTLTFDREMTLHLGDMDVRLIHYGHSHGIADTVVAVPGENLVLTAGIFYATHVPELAKVTEDATPEEIDNWFVVMHGILDAADPDTRFLASHGRAILGKARIQAFVAYLEAAWKGVRRARSAGKTLEQARAEIRLADHPQVAALPNEMLRGSEWENLDIHGRNVERMWKVLDRRSR